MSAGLFDLTGRTTVVTGGNRALGLAMARALLDHVARVMIVGRDKSALEQGCQGLSAFSSDVDATDADLVDDVGIERFA
jgi:NAD(P)-dependent dehydrogenase (short-subunit alcohol dehydrogenase family)